MTIYNSFTKPLAFKVDAERMHRIAMRALRAWQPFCDVKLADNDIAKDPELHSTALDLSFRNPLGLAAGFDKNAECIPAWQALGFGFVEVGTVTPHAQAGNPKPRMWRLPKDHALMNRLGFNNEGVDAVVRRIAAFREAGVVHVPIGINIGKGRDTEARWAKIDYDYCLRHAYDVGDYFVVNVSSPNTVGLRDLQQIAALEPILDEVCATRAFNDVRKPLLVKLAPDLSDEDAIAIASLCVRKGIDGLVVSNTTISREGLTDVVPEGAGGISGGPVYTRSTVLLGLLNEMFGKKLVLVGVGGVHSGATAKAKFEAGATLIQSYTGFVYEGPGFARKVLRELFDLR